MNETRDYIYLEFYRIIVGSYFCDDFYFYIYGFVRLESNILCLFNDVVDFLDDCCPIFGV